MLQPLAPTALIRKAQKTTVRLKSIEHAFLDKIFPHILRRIDSEKVFAQS
ncbi:MAG: hypothetical protein V3U10_04780 [Bacteroidota bacterium]